MNASAQDLVPRIHRDLRDDFDEQLELELKDRNLDALSAALGDGQCQASKAERQAYLRELLRLQAELVKLQDWLVAITHKAQATRHKAVILFDRSWYKRAGVERTMGFCNDDPCEEIFRAVAPPPGGIQQGQASDAGTHARPRCASVGRAGRLLMKRGTLPVKAPAQRM